MYKKCPKYYYYNSLNRYKCTEDDFCPKDKNLLIKEKGRCIDKCKNDNIYKYQYDTLCLKECPNGTIKDEINFICKDENNNEIKLTETNHIFF